MKARIGVGYDVHPLVPNRRLVLGGVEISFDKGLSGHSDADVLTHAVMDALLGAAGLKDIGSHFPPEEAKYKDISSLTLLAEVRSLLEKRKLKITNIDATVVAQEPKVAPFVDEMRHRLSQTLEIDSTQIAVKATTTDGLGFVGRQEGIAAIAVAMVEA